MYQPPQEEISNLEAVMAELRRVQAESATSQAQFMDEVDECETHIVLSSFFHAYLRL